jgi:hypothetical protein
LKEAGDGIRSHIYVDDYLASAGQMEDTVRNATGVKKVLVDGDFPLFNSTELLAAVQQVAERGAAVEAMPCNLVDYPVLILGIVWNPSSDRLGFRLKRILSCVHWGIKGLKWDDLVVGNEKAWWEQYFKKIEERFKVFEFARCLFPKV